MNLKNFNFTVPLSLWAALFSMCYVTNAFAVADTHCATLKMDLMVCNTSGGLPGFPVDNWFIVKNGKSYVITVTSRQNEQVVGTLTNVPTDLGSLFTGTVRITFYPPASSEGAAAVGTLFEDTTGGFVQYPIAPWILTVR